MRIAPTLAVLGSAVGLIAAAPPTGSNTVYATNPMSVVCSSHAKEQAATAMSMLDAVEPCTAAIDSEPLDKHQLAVTYVNRGVIWMTGKMIAEAQADFDTAVRTDPRVGEAYVNRGAALVARKQYAEGLADIDRGISLGVEEPQRAWFNRGLAMEAMDDLKGAYDSYQRALELAPGWTAPRIELARFSVSR